MPVSSHAGWDFGAKASHRINGMVSGIMTNFLNTPRLR